MQIPPDQYADDRTSQEELLNTLAWIGLAVAGGVAVALAARWYRRSNSDSDAFVYSFSDERAVTVKAPIELVEAAWVDWCASGNTRLANDYVVRFEPAPGARGTEVHLSGGGTIGALRDELRRFKQRLETGEIPASDGPGLSHPARPRQHAATLTEIL